MRVSSLVAAVCLFTCCVAVHGAVVRIALPLKLAWALTVLPPHT